MYALYHASPVTTPTAPPFNIGLIAGLIGAVIIIALKTVGTKEA
jgi:hypothetical protein